MDVDGDGTGTEESANDDVASGSTVKSKAVSIVHVARVCNNGKYGRICCMQHVAHVACATRL